MKQSCYYAKVCDREFNKKHIRVILLSLHFFSLKHSGRHMALSCLVTLSISLLRNLHIEANKFYDRAHRLYNAAPLTRCYTQHFLGILSKFNLSIRNALTYPVYLKINLLSLLFPLILKIRNPLSSVVSIINLFVVLFFNIAN